MTPSRVAMLLAGAAVVVVSGCASPTPSAPPSQSTASPVTSATAAPTQDAATESWLAKGGCASLPVTTQETPSASPSAKAEPAILTIKGTLSKVKSPARLTMADLDTLPQVQCTVFDRQAEGRNATFRGVLVSTLLDHVGAKPRKRLHTVALNDYAVDLPASDVTEVPMLLATRLDGRPMSVAHYGPTRVIYPTKGFDLDPTVYDPRWIWQLTSIVVE